MGFLGRLFGTEKAISDITDKDNGLLVRAGGWVNDFSYTDAEKAANSLEVRKWGLNQLEALAPFKVVQRILAFAISFVWIVVAINVLAAIWIEAANPQFLIKEAMLSFAFSDFVFWPVTVCFGLYFGGGLIESIRKAK
jgi:hypothetical protein